MSETKAGKKSARGPMPSWRSETKVGSKSIKMKTGTTPGGRGYAITREARDGEPAVYHTSLYSKRSKRYATHTKLSVDGGAASEKRSWVRPEAGPMNWGPGKKISKGPTKPVRTRKKK